MFSHPTDITLDRMQLKTQLKRWRYCALAAVILAILAFSVERGKTPLHSNYIARIEINDIIMEDSDRDEILDNLQKDTYAKAVLVYINSPGGTVVGSEKLYNQIRAIAETRPVVSVLGTVAASGGYMTAIASDYIVAHQGTITGSIGVLLQSAEFTELAKKMGVNFLTFKSGELKGEPSPFEKPSPAVEKMINATIRDTYNMFVEMVAERRNLKQEEAIARADGRIYTGRQALTAKLVDGLGGEAEALRWLREEKNIPTDTLPIKNVKLYKDENPFREFTTLLPSSWQNIRHRLTTPAVMALWQPGL